ncbi:LysR substrate-binding domain-containing protein [Raoultella terrigena]|uniref:LysR substrate-binding domain-containing protein n=1 Tax=Raoultella terrigena TaxID=577 RepID=UPI00132F8824
MELIPAGSALASINIAAAIGIITAGTGIGYVPDFVVRDALEKGDLREVLPGSCVRQGHFCALWAARRHLSSRIRRFVDFLAENWMKSSRSQPLCAYR